jgi:hypothetical protein
MCTISMFFMSATLVEHGSGLVVGGPTTRIELAEVGGADNVIC